LVAIAMSGCSTIKTKPLGAADSLRPGNAALQYYLPKGVVTISVFRTDGLDANGAAIKTYRVALSDVTYVPDTQQKLELYYDSDFFAEDILTVGVSSKGLLTKANVSSEDKTGAIVVKMAELGKEIAKGLALLEATPKETTVLTRTFNPINIAEINDINAATTGWGITLNSSTATAVAAAKAAAPVPFQETSGVAYRPLIPCELEIVQNGAKLQSVYYVPDPSVVNTFPMYRRAFIKMVSNVTFDNGVLTEFTINKPSETLGFLTPAVDLVKMITSIPSELLTVTVNQNKDETALLQAEKALIDAQTALSQAQKK